MIYLSRSQTSVGNKEAGDSRAAGQKSSIMLYSLTPSLPTHLLLQTAVTVLPETGLPCSSVCRAPTSLTPVTFSNVSVPSQL